ncbi:MAG: ABC transporter substrate-binding protein [Clostridia bacterium]|nr:ABC transporter substrate-binding protein [Clostridia bacterium]
MNKKILSFILAALMIVACFAGCAPADGDKDTDNKGNEEVVKNENKVIIGSTTDLSGDFRFPGWGGSSAGASDQDVNKLTVGYSTMETNQGGAYVWNNTAVKSHTEAEDENGNLVVTIEINEGLKFSDGSDIKAVNYIAYILAFSSPVVESAAHPGMVGQALVGFDSYKAYTGAEAEGATKEFAGVRLLGDYTFSLTVNAAKGYYPYYFANTYGAFSPYPTALILGDGVEIKDDGNGAYLEGNWYDMDGETYAKKSHIEEARYDVTKYPFSGPYTVKEWDEGTKQATLELNPIFAGNFEGQKPSIKTIVYTKIVQETQLDQFKTGQVDILSGVTGGEDTNAALAVVDESDGKFAETHYQRAGYGKLQFDCDFGPTMFQSVRQAIAYVLNTNEFAAAFTGGYGTVVYGPYSPDFDMWQAVKDDIELIDYSYSVENAKAVLVADGWVYNSKGEDFVEGQTGVDAVRYKKLTADEAAVLNGVNKTFASVENTDGVTYKTVEVNGEYYMPLVINWFGTTPNDVTEMLAARLVGTADVKAIGMVVRSSVGDFDKLLGEIYREPSYGYGGTPTYGMFNLATGWNSAVYDYAFNWSLDPAYFSYSTNKLYDENDVAFPYYDAEGNHTKMSYADAVAASGDKLGMDYISMAMVYDATTEAEYNDWWKAYIERWNELMPDIPLYSNYYFDIYNAKIENFKTSPFWSPVDALLYSTIKNAE